MDSVEEELGIVSKRLMVKILSEDPSARCLFSYIIMKKGGYWVGVFFVVVTILSIQLYSYIT
jgi:hypothetical protein